MTADELNQSLYDEWDSLGQPREMEVVVLLMDGTPLPITGISIIDGGVTMALTTN